MSEVWKPVSGYEGFYEVSNMGRVRRVEHSDKSGHVYKQRILSLKSNRRGYKRVHLSKNGVARWHSVHRLVATEFCEKPDGMDVVNHIDSNPENNVASNLEWTDDKGNMQHAASKGRMTYNPNNLKKAQQSRRVPVVAIDSDGTRIEFESGAAAARALGVNSGHIAACCRKEYGYKTLKGYRFEYLDKDLQSRQKPNKVGMTKEEHAKLTSKRMKGNQYGKGAVLSEERKRMIAIDNGRPVAQIDIQTGETITTFISANDAKKQTGISHINDCACGRRKTAGGYLWKWIE